MSPMVDLSHYPDVELLLNDLRSRVQVVLGDAFVGMYLYGSLASGGFDPARSDIDFVVVTRDELRAAMIDQLQQMHCELWAGEQKWARKLEGQYIPLAELRRYNAQGPALPTVNEGKFYLAGQGRDWVIQRHVLREHEAVVAGPSMRAHIDPVGAEEMRDAVTAVLQEWWAPMLDDPSWLEDRPDYQAFAAQTMCRVLYTLRFGTAVSKADAARWASAALDEGLRPLIETVMAWTPGDPPLGVAEAVRFIRLAVTESAARP